MSEIKTQANQDVLVAPGVSIVDDVPPGENAMSTRQETDTVEDRKREIIRLVAEAFQAENDRVSNLELVIRKANISTAEVTECFGSVNQLLLQMVTALTDSVLVPLDDHAVSEASLESVLLAFGENVVNGYRNSYVTGIYRIALTEATRHTGMAQELFERGPGRITERLAEVLEQYHRAGTIRDGDMRLYADHFLALLGRDTLEFFGDHSFSGGDRRAAVADVVADAVSILCSGIAEGGL